MQCIKLLIRVVQIELYYSNTLSSQLLIEYSRTVLDRTDTRSTGSFLLRGGQNKSMPSYSFSVVENLQNSHLG